jgi:hypothetical protein
VAQIVSPILPEQIAKGLHQFVFRLLVVAQENLTDALAVFWTVTQSARFCRQLQSDRAYQITRYKPGEFSIYLIETFGFKNGLNAASFLADNQPM